MRRATDARAGDRHRVARHGHLLAAVVDTRSPQLAEPSQLLSATVAVLVLGGLINVIIDWWARRVLLAADDEQRHVSRDPSAVIRARGAIASWLARQMLTRPSADSVASRPRDDADRGPAPGHTVVETLTAPLFPSFEVLERTPKEVFESLRPDRLGKITAREIQILDHPGAGLDHEDIATTLGIATATVDDHVRHIRDKAGEADSADTKRSLGGGDTRLLALRLPKLPGNQDET